MSHVDLCSGIGGFALGFEWAGLSKPVLFCDIEPWSRKVLAKHWPDVPIAEDVKELANDPARLVPDCDILTAGYPCQPFSVAGKQRGTEDDRHLWPFISQIIAHKRPAFCVLENVFGHVALGLDEVLADLEAQDYAARAFIVPACAVNAPHRRDRIWIIGRNVGNSEHDGSSAATVSGKHREDDARGAERQSASEQSEGASEPGHDANVGNAGCVTKGQSRNGLSEERLNSGTQGQWSVEGHRLANTSENVADTDNEGSQGRLSGRRGAEWQGEHGHAGCSSAAHRQPAKDWWAVEPAMGRVAHGIPRRVDRLKGLGNAIVPQIAMQIGLTIKALRDA
jgi:DNA (cytosine-5)-methyltransferase 1